MRTGVALDGVDDLLEPLGGEGVLESQPGGEAVADDVEVPEMTEASIIFLFLGI